mmetsp:Transcript_17224/g.40051  ORF Transcript_17224/g.40051 Transcript_17224/m.40051 type:complete len:372 (+) Transcript_17224:1513-2628(+)
MRAPDVPRSKPTKQSPSPSLTSGAPSAPASASPSPSSPGSSVAPSVAPSMVSLFEAPSVSPPPLPSAPASLAFAPAFAPAEVVACAPPPPLTPSPASPIRSKMFGRPDRPRLMTSPFMLRRGTFIPSGCSLLGSVLSCISLIRSTRLTVSTPLASPESPPLPDAVYILWGSKEPLDGLGSFDSASLLSDLPPPPLCRLLGVSTVDPPASPEAGVPLPVVEPLLGSEAAKLNVPSRLSSSSPRRPVAPAPRGWEGGSLPSPSSRAKENVDSRADWSDCPSSRGSGVLRVGGDGARDSKTSTESWKLSTAKSEEGGAGGRRPGAAPAWADVDVRDGASSEEKENVPSRSECRPLSSDSSVLTTSLGSGYFRLL